MGGGGGPAPQGAKLKVVGYARRSQERDNGYGLQDQEDKIRRWVTYKDADLVGFFQDDDVSGRAKPEDRPGLGAALAMLTSGDAEGLVFAKLDRLARSVMIWGRLVERAETEGWAIVCLDPEFDTSTAAGRLVANVFASVGQWEVENFVERMQGGRQTKRKMGGYIGGPRFGNKYGYELTKVGARFEWMPVANEQEIIRIARDLRTDGYTLQRIADHLNSTNLPTRTGGKWWPSSVRRLLDSKSVTGSV